MDNPIKVNGKIIKCMVMESYSILEIEFDTKDNFKMDCSMVLELSMPFNKYPKDRLKLIKLLLGFIKEAGLNIKEGSKMIKDKDLEKLSLKMEFG